MQPNLVVASLSPHGTPKYSSTAFLILLVVALQIFLLGFCSLMNFDSGFCPSALWWDGLAENNRRILKKSFPSVEKSRSATRAQNVLDLEDPQLEIRIHELNAVQQQEWRQRSAAVTELLLTTIGGRAREIYDLILQGQAEYRKTD